MDIDKSSFDKRNSLVLLWSNCLIQLLRIENEVVQNEVCIYAFEFSLL